ncbi:MAG: diguanylate cyclase [Solirubrobacteraceae bacterium]|nr:diguanylate cyclase [Solirubrobacteraceae bacterium]
MTSPFLRRTYLVPAVILLLGLLSIGLLATLQSRADTARLSETQVARVTVALERLGAAPRALAGASSVDEAALELKRNEGRIAEEMELLLSAEPPPALVKADEAIRATQPRTRELFTLAERGQLFTSAGQEAGARQVAAQREATRQLDRAAEAYRAQAEFAGSQVLQGTVLTVILLLCVFAFFYTRSVQEHRVSRRLFAENEVLLAASRDEALTDALTGLHNRRALAEDLEAQLPNATDDERVLLALFDLDGFKSYNDTFGHAAGDELLNRLGRNLTKAAEATGAKAYRLGGDEFCVLTQLPVGAKGDRKSEELIEAAVDALTDEGEGWEIGTSVGTVWVPGDAVDVEAALVLADERMYSNKATRKNTKSTLRSLTDDSVQRAEDGEALGRVAQMASLIAEHLTLPEEEVDAVRIAAGLYDIGKTAIPDSILTKEGELDENDWAFIHKHTIMSGRLVYASSERAHVAELVRSSHEHFDGKGYPDGLAGQEIPLGARIIAVCDAYNAMTSERPFRKAMSPAVALRELENCAGSQFDPVVVDAFFASAAERAESLQGAKTAPVDR